ncbi:MAG: cheW 2 [Planctomycetaceae bacterium]|nr:cheW 2 [Planctomycetaceae bacterium]
MLNMSDVETICTFTLDGLFLGISVGEVHEVLLAQTLTPVPLAHPVVAGLINMRGQIVPVVDLRRVLRLPARADDAPPPVHVIVRNGHDLMSLLVDQFGDVLELEARLFTPPPDTANADTKHLFRGAYQLPLKLLLVFDTQHAIEAIVSQAGSKVLRGVT